MEKLVTKHPKQNISGAQVITYLQIKMPASPGVYRMINFAGEVLYVGKAKNLKNRLAAYTHPKRHSIRIQRMIAQTKDIEIVKTDTEVEALLLEADLIKRYQPRYNILLRDDKSFPTILLTSDHGFAQLLKHRGAKRRKGEYFGPFTSAWAVNETINLLQRAFLLRTCSDNIFANRTRPCLLYQIKRCSAPCVGKISKSAYSNLVGEARSFLSGNDHKIQKSFAKRMQEASDAEKFELAAQYRDRIKALSKIQLQNDVAPKGIKDADIIGAYQVGGKTCIQVFFFRSSRNYGNRAYFPLHNKDCSLDEVIEAFIGQFYAKLLPARTILISHQVVNPYLVKKMLQLRAGYNVNFCVPKRGEKSKLTKLAVINACESLKRRMLENKTQLELFGNLAKLLALPKMPERIEIYDNSHISGTRPVGGMVVAGPEGFIKKAYRKFNIRTEMTPGDDYAMIKEVLTRRFKRCLKEDPNRETKQWPDLIIIDGGKGQLSMAHSVLKNLNIADIPLAAIAKGSNRNSANDRIFLLDKKPLFLEPNSPVLYLIQRLRDEAHRFAIGAHRARRKKGIRTSILDRIPGVGPKRKKSLLHHFGSSKAVSEASAKDLEDVDGIDRFFAIRIYDWFHASG